MLVFGFLVFNSRSPTVSMKKLVTRIFEKISK
jgi:hypothetical protein